MKVRLIFKDSKNEIITADIKIELKDTKGIYSTGKATIDDFDLIGCQWLEEEPESRINIKTGIESVEVFDMAVSSVMESLEKTREAYFR